MIMPLLRSYNLGLEMQIYKHHVPPGLDERRLSACPAGRCAICLRGRRNHHRKSATYPKPCAEHIEEGV
jgi:hypothetical protein